MIIERMRNLKAFRKKIKDKFFPKLSLPEHGFELADIISSIDSSVQKAYFCASKNDKPRRQGVS